MKDIEPISEPARLSLSVELREYFDGLSLPGAIYFTDGDEGWVTWYQPDTTGCPPMIVYALRSESDLCQCRHVLSCINDYLTSPAMRTKVKVSTN